MILHGDLRAQIFLWAETLNFISSLELTSRRPAPNTITSFPWLMSLRKSLTLSPHPGTNGDSRSPKNAAILPKSSFSPFPIYSFNFTVSFTSEAFGVSSQKSSIFKSPSSVCNVTDWKRKIKHTILVLLSSLLYLSCAEKARGNLPLTIFLG